MARVLFLIPLLLTLTSARRTEFQQLAGVVSASDSQWTAGLAGDIDYDDEELLQRMGSGSFPDDQLVEEELDRPRRPRFLQTAAAAPALRTVASGALPILDASQYPSTLDLRLKYQACSSIRMIRNQASCASCWAFASMNVISDNHCIRNLGAPAAPPRLFSPQDSLECCPTCYFDPKNTCGGGYLYQSFKFAATEGIVSGDAFSLNGLCKPYYLPETELQLVPSPGCRKACGPGASAASYAQDKLRISDFLYGKGVGEMIAALNTYGSIAVTMTVYRDLYVYKSGVYTFTSGAVVGGHAVRIVGYGTEAGVDYWLVANSWGAGWGENGFFKIRRGTNECRIEAGYFFAALIK